MSATVHISGLIGLRSGMTPPRGEEAADRTADMTEKPLIPTSIRAPEPIQRKFQARPDYDPIEADVFLEILDPETGEVLQRFPAEKAAEDEIANHGDTIFIRLA